MTGARFSPDGKVLFFRETTGQNSVDYAVYLAEPAQKLVVMRTGSDFYANPGTMMGVRRRRRLAVAAAAVARAGAGRS